MNRYWLKKLVPTTNTFEEIIAEKLDNSSVNVKMEKIAKPPSIFIANIDNFLSLSQLLKEIAIDDYEIKIINNKQVKI